MPRAVKRPYDNTRRQAQVRATRLRIIEAAKGTFQFKVSSRCVMERTVLGWDRHACPVAGGLGW